MGYGLYKYFSDRNGTQTKLKKEDKHCRYLQLHKFDRKKGEGVYR